jgi:lysophospholipase L1-like esterase
VNRGIASLSARDLEQILPDCLPPVRISGAVLYTGAADWRASGRDAEVLAVRVDSVIRTLARLRPSVPVVLLGILPERHRERAAVDALHRANRRLRDLARERGTTFVETARPPIADASGSLSEGLSVDDLHLNEEGYRVLAGWIAADGGEVGSLLTP